MLRAPTCDDNREGKKGKQSSQFKSGELLGGMKLKYDILLTNHLTGINIL